MTASSLTPGPQRREAPAVHVFEHSATELARRIRARELSCEHVVRATLERIALVNPRINCFCAIDAEGALAQARAADAALAAGAVPGPLHGVPFAIKDLTPTRGLPTTLGSLVYQNSIATHDAVIVERLRGAGGILVGKTTTPEFAHLPITHNRLHGITRNPWDASRTPGGSSGGSAAAVASGCVPLAEGSDMGGSIRIPAALCGIVGFKPSLGRIPFDALPSQFESLAHFGPLARTVADAALFVRVTQGPSNRDYQSQMAPSPIPDELSTDLRSLRVACSTDLGYYHVDEDVAANFRHAVESMRGAGAIVDEVPLHWNSTLNDAWVELWAVYMAAFYGHDFDRDQELFEPSMRALMTRGFEARAVDIKRIELTRSRFWEDLSALLSRYDVLVCPTTSTVAPAVETPMAELYFTDARGRYHGLDLTSHFNFVGACPAISIPAGVTLAGLPTGLHIVGRRYDDVRVLALAAELERTFPWARSRLPPG
jgi:Asp-tRNA(Asn)/Glu-tRNA(Gln) amidotransferase A subunit family amidase